VTTINIRPLSGTLGAEIHGVRLGQLTDREWDAIRVAWLEHLVLFFPDQHLSPDEHVAFGRRFGELEVHPFLQKLDEEHPEVIVLDSATGGRADTWHADVTFSDTPPMASILQMRILPRRGGDTIWSNQYLAYEALSPATKAFLNGLTAVHTAATFGHPERQACHPLVTVHPETGRRILFVNSEFTSHIAELGHAESEAVLRFLYRWNERPERQCRYQWSEGCIGVWDNRCTQHYAVNDYSERRVINRVTVVGSRPQGAPSAWDEVVDKNRTKMLNRGTKRHGHDTRTNPVATA
jgi:taurine dioxygenase